MDNEAEKDRWVTVIANSDRLIEAITKGGVAYLGYKAAKDHWTGALTALVALKLATGGNLAGGAAGTAVLTMIGLDQIKSEVPADLLQMIGGVTNPFAAISQILKQTAP